jgi:hypothetical protein
LPAGDAELAAAWLTAFILRFLAIRYATAPKSAEMNDVRRPMTSQPVALRVDLRATRNLKPSAPGEKAVEKRLVG